MNITPTMARKMCKDLAVKHVEKILAQERHEVVGKTVTLKSNPDITGRVLRVIETPFGQLVRIKGFEKYQGDTVAFALRDVVIS
jgi:hypothetical protein